MGAELKEMLVERVWKAGGQQLAALPGIDLHELLRQSSFKDVPLELIAEEILRNVDIGVDDVLGWMANAEPNLNHCVLATLSRAPGCSIITTNFDELIERSGGTHIHKLHGTISSASDLVIKLSQVGRGLADAAFRRRVKSLLEGKSVVFMGYAGRDLDILPVLSALNFRDVLWFARPARSATDLALVGGELQQCTRLARRCTSFRCLSVDADLVMDELGRALKLTCRTYPSRVPEWRSELLFHTLTADSEKAAVAMIRVFGAAGLWRTAADGCKWLLSRLPSAQLKLQITLYLAEAFYWLGRYEECETTARETRYLARLECDVSTEARALQILGLSLSRAKESVRRGIAARYMADVPRLLEGRRDLDALKLLGANGLNLGIWQKNRGKLIDADRSLRQALQVVRKSGDLRMQQKIHNAIGIVFRRVRQRLIATGLPASRALRSSRYHLRAARDLAASLGSASEELRVILALIDLELDAPLPSKKLATRVRGLLRRADVLVPLSAEPEHAARVMEVKGKILAAEGRSEEAIDTFTDAMRGMKTNSGLASAFQSRAAALNMLNRNEEAFRDLAAATRLVPRGPDYDDIRRLMRRVRPAPKRL